MSSRDGSAWFPQPHVVAVVVADTRRRRGLALRPGLPHAEVLALDRPG